MRAAFAPRPSPARPRDREVAPARARGSALGVGRASSFGRSSGGGGSTRRNAVIDPTAATTTEDDREDAGDDPVSASASPADSASGSAADSASLPDGVATERGVPFHVRGAFYRAESRQARDLAVLLASDMSDPPRILDAMAGTGVRCARYLLQSGASHVHANDASRDAHDALLSTVCDLRASGVGADARRPGSTVAVTRRDARRLLAGMYAADDERFDIVDVDSFGVDNFVDAALPMVKHGGYLYVTCTDALALCGKNPPALSSRFGGAHVAANVPGVNETALRVFVGDAVRRGAAQGLRLTPVFSLFHPHGPVFRAMLRVEPSAGAWTSDDVGYVGQCWECGEARRLDGGKELGGCFCHRCADAGDVTVAMDVSGPMWLGPLHERETIRRLREREAAVGWDDDDETQGDASSASAREETPKGQKTTAKLLEVFEEESDPNLPPFYHRTDELGRAGRGMTGGIPPMDAWIAELRRRGFAACKSHVDARGLKTNATVAEANSAANAVTAAKAKR